MGLRGKTTISSRLVSTKLSQLSGGCEDEAGQVSGAAKNAGRRFRPDFTRRSLMGAVWKRRAALRRRDAMERTDRATTKGANSKTRTRLDREESAHARRSA